VLLVLGLSLIRFGFLRLKQGNSQHAAQTKEAAVFRAARISRRP
jgi:hypothetical protein